MKKTLKFKHNYNGEVLEVTVEGSEVYVTAFANAIRATALSNHNWDDYK